MIAHRQPASQAPSDAPYAGACSLIAVQSLVVGDATHLHSHQHEPWSGRHNQADGLLHMNLPDGGGLAPFSLVRPTVAGQAHQSHQSLVILSLFPLLCSVMVLLSALSLASMVVSSLMPGRAALHWTARTITTTRKRLHAHGVCTGACVQRQLPVMCVTRTLPSLIFWPALPRRS